MNSQNLNDQKSVAQTAANPAQTEVETKQNNRAAQLADGQITLAEYVGLGKKELYVIAEQAHRLLISGKLEEAKDIYQGLVAADPYDSVFHCHLGAAQLRLGKPDEAFEQFELSLQYNIHNVDAFVGRAEILLSRGDVPAAIADFTRALELDKEGKRASTMRARATLLALKDTLEKQVAGEQSASGGK